MRVKNHPAALSAVCALLTGCAHDLRVHAMDADKPRVGIGYVLPYTQFAVTETWTLDYCPDPAKADRALGSQPRIALKVAATPSSADDGSLAFVIDPRELQTLTSVTTLNATYFDGRNMLSTINASVEDRSAQVIGNIVKTAVKILPLAMGGPGAPGGEKGSTVIKCSDGAAKALATAKTAKGKLDAANGVVDKRTAELTALTTKVQQMGANVDDATKKALSDALDLLTQARSDQSDATDDLNQALKPLTFSRTVTWPTDGTTFSHGPDVLPSDYPKKWLKDATSVTPRPVYLQIERVGTFGRSPDRPNLTPKPIVPLPPLPGDESASPLAASTADLAYKLPNDAIPGIRYRMPVAGRIVACFRSPCGSEDAAGVIASFDSPVAQLGFVNVLPFRTRTFGTNTFNAAFNQDGSLKSAGYEQKSAPAEAATGALADAAGQVADVVSPTARLQAGTAYLKALKDQRDAYQALIVKDPSATATQQASLDADTALTNSKISNLNAQIALAQLQAKQGAAQ